MEKWFFGRDDEMRAVWNESALELYYRGDFLPASFETPVDKGRFRDFGEWFEYLLASGSIVVIDEPQDMAWRVYDDKGLDYAWFEVHLSEDLESPSGIAWYFDGLVREPDGRWESYDGGMYWGYPDAQALFDDCDVACWPDRFCGEIVEADYREFEEEIS